MEQITINTYKFEELDEAGKKLAIKEHREFLNEVGDDGLLSEDIRNEMERLIEEGDFYEEEANLKIYYDLGHSQSDYLIVEGYFNIGNTHVNIHLGNRNSTVIEFTDDFGDEVTGDPDFIESYEELIGTLKTFGYNEIEYKNSDISIEAEIEVNEYDFLKNGKQVPYYIQDLVE